jgi:GNAT superfamily N-acetyltransferase
MGLRTALENTASALWSDERVWIKPITTQAELIYAIFDCRLTEEQKELVNPAGFSIGRAYLFREDNIPCLICNEHMEPVGFINLCKWLGEGDAYSWSFFIDRDHQGKGYGKRFFPGGGIIPGHIPGGKTFDHRLGQQFIPLGNDFVHMNTPSIMKHFRYKTLSL